MLSVKPIRAGVVGDYPQAGDQEGTLKWETVYSMQRDVSSLLSIVAVGVSDFRPSHPSHPSHHPLHPVHGLRFRSQPP
jgi:hypothetical protein